MNISTFKIYDILYEEFAIVHWINIIWLYIQMTYR